MLVEKKILELQISVYDVFFVKVVDTRDELGKEALRVAVFEVFIGKNMVEQLSSWSLAPTRRRAYLQQTPVLFQCTCQCQ
jgi:hypothetical protein